MQQKMELLGDIKRGLQGFFIRAKGVKNSETEYQTKVRHQ